MGNRHIDEPGHDPTWGTEPFPHRKRTVGERGSEQRVEASHAPSRGRRLGDHEEPSHDTGVPATVTANPRRQPELPIERRDHRLRVRNHGFDLDHEQGTSGLQPAEDVDGATLAEVAEGNFDRRLPAALVERAEHLVDKGRVGSIEQAIQRLAMPSNPDVEVSAERRSCRDERLDRDASKLSALDAPVLRPRHPGPRRDVGLAQAAMQAQRSERSTDPERLHGPSMAVVAYRAISVAPSATLMPMRQLDGRTALVFGVATRHSIAWAIAEELAGEGARIGLVYRRPETARRIAALVRSVGAELALPCDVRDDAAVAAVMADASRTFGHVDILVHALANAPRAALEGRFVDTSRSDFQAALDVSAFSLIALAKAAEPLMPPGSSIVTLSAIGSRRVIPGYNVMGVGKAALEASMRQLAVDLGPSGIRVNAVSAGAVRTVAAMGVPGFRTLYRQGAALAPMRRGLTSRDVAAAVTWLAGPGSAAVTGQVIEVDGGWSVLALSGSPNPG